MPHPYLRFSIAKPSVGFIKNFGLKRGALASSVAHDSHNIIAIGATDADVVKAINCLMDSKGGIVAVEVNQKLILPLPVAGLMSTESAENVAEKYLQLNNKAKALGSPLNSLVLSFLTVIDKASFKTAGVFVASTLNHELIPPFSSLTNFPFSNKPTN